MWECNPCRRPPRVWLPWYIALASCLPNDRWWSGCCGRGAPDLSPMDGVPRNRARFKVNIFNKANVLLASNANTMFKKNNTLSCGWVYKLLRGRPTIYSAHKIGQHCLIPTGFVIVVVVFPSRFPWKPSLGKQAPKYSCIYVHIRSSWL
ncbi:uncharacterized protein GGS25DRAFT_233584 [Hypoxylon fragiforme]|uniref:uncharacterized protein n=1 Tax=Hypoxylon fragiforme TaxID=63214 RepID=UPI0020C6A6DC|nr:uncharacterized protein GGS25DRAFT_233584 [Hypoxylon fragiforme]KAI2609782.1 hypothetical protein GGS25DRAFT_233584 [Hypoxylon fragiforme]